MMGPFVYGLIHDLHIYYEFNRVVGKNFQENFFHATASLVSFWLSFYVRQRSVDLSTSVYSLSSLYLCSSFSHLFTPLISSILSPLSCPLFLPPLLYSPILFHHSSILDPFCPFRLPFMSSLLVLSCTL